MSAIEEVGLDLVADWKKLTKAEYEDQFKNMSPIPTVMTLVRALVMKLVRELVMTLVRALVMTALLTKPLSHQVPLRKLETWPVLSGRKKPRRKRARSRIYPENYY